MSAICIYPCVCGCVASLGKNSTCEALGLTGVETLPKLNSESSHIKSYYFHSVFKNEQNKTNYLF
jgi:hypothetical protein